MPDSARLIPLRLPLHLVGCVFFFGGCTLLVVLGLRGHQKESHRTRGEPRTQTPSWRLVGPSSPGLSGVCHGPEAARPLERGVDRGPEEAAWMQRPVGCAEEGSSEDPTPNVGVGSLTVGWHPRAMWKISPRIPGHVPVYHWNWQMESLIQLK